MPAYRTKTTKDNKRKKVKKGTSLDGSRKIKITTNKKTGKTKKVVKNKETKVKTKVKY